MQNYKNHIRYYIPHHFVFYPLLCVLLFFSIREAIRNDANSLLWIFVAIGLALVGWLSFMLRQHYAMTLQNRLVIMEMRFRYYVLTQQRLEILEDRLSFGQIAALRFASDEELPALVDRTVLEGLSAERIKKAIVKWLPDHRRV